MPKFEAQLARTGGWVAGTPSPSYADATLYAAVEFAAEVGVDFGAHARPALARWRAAFEALPGVSAYLGGPYHWGHPDDHYVAEVRAALAT